MRARDLVLAWTGSLLLAGGVVWGAVRSGTDRQGGHGGALTRLAAAEEAALFPALATDGAAGAEGGRVRIDPETLTIVGLDLTPPPGHSPVAWDVLQSYEYQEGLAGLPEALRALDGQKVTLAGFMLTLYEFDDIKEFSLVGSHWSCCFGMPPGLNGWVHVQLATGETGLPNTSEPIKVSGTFRVREMKEAGYVIAIYALEEASAAIIGW